MQFNIGADDADRWRKKLKHPRKGRWRLNSDIVIWALIVVAMAIAIMLIVLKAA